MSDRRVVHEVPFYGSRQMVRQLRRDGICVGRHRVRRREPACRIPCTGFILIFSKGWLGSGAPTSPISPSSVAFCTSDRTGRRATFYRRNVEHHGRWILRRGLGRRAGPLRPAGDIQYGSIQGKFNRSSQGIGGCYDGTQTAGRIGLEASCIRQVDRTRHGVKLVRFWATTGRSSEDAARDAGVSPPVGSRWFRRSACHHFIAIGQDQDVTCLSRNVRRLLFCAPRKRLRQACRLERAPSTISREVRAQRGDPKRWPGLPRTTAQWHTDRSAKRPKPAKLATNEALRLLCAGSACGSDLGTGWNGDRGATRRLERSSAWAAAAQAMGQGLES